MKSIIHLLIFFGCTFTALVAVAQETGGRLEGTARDTAGIPLAGAVYTSEVLPSGLFYFNGLRIGGPYQLTATYVGMNKVTLSDLQVRLGDPLRVELLFIPEIGQLGAVVVSGKKTGSQVGRYGTGTNIT